MEDTVQPNEAYPCRIWYGILKDYLTDNKTNHR